eukprot:4239107-Alexandrium_andersonii.AAC.1
MDVELHPTPVLAPHEVLHAISRAGSQQRLMSVVGPELLEGLAEFWTHAMGLEWGQRHPGMQNRDLLHHTAPLVFHMDGVE